MENNPSPYHFVAPQIEDLRPLFPSYELGHFIAQGGMGAVYHARQISLDRPVAIKILPREFGEDAAFRASFEAEAKAMAKLNHPNLISIFDFGEVDGMPFLIMEYVNGKSLYHSSHGHAVDAAQAVSIVTDICHGLDHAHKAGILHRDVKPANILLTPEAVPKIGDFGLAGPMEGAVSDDETIYGTPGYTAPEITHRAKVDHRADIFSTGVLLHELITGSLPNESKTPASQISTSPPALDSIIARATHANPAFRYESASEMADALQKAISTPLTHTPLNLSTAPQTVKPAQTAVVSKKSSSGPILIGILSVAAVIAVVAMMMGSGKEEPETAAPIAEQGPSQEPRSTNTNTRQKADKPAQPVVQQPATDKKPEPVKRTENVIDALARLKSDLTSGKRDEFPPQAIEHEGSHFVMIPKAMNLKNATQFATDHGAHLAVLSDPLARQKLAQEMKIKKPAWLAAGKAARNAWQWMDGSPWKETTNPNATSDNDRHILINSGGSLAAESSDSEHVFVIQWRKNTENPCSIEAQLDRTSTSIKEKGIDSAIYPVGTRTYEKSHFLLIDKQLNWENAHQFAKSHGSLLAVPSNGKEQAWILKTFAAKDRSAWLGGYLLDDSSPWRWISNEPFSSFGWKPGEPSSSASKNRILLDLKNSTPTPCWASTEGTRGEATHILLEWSKPEKTTSSTASFDLKKWLDGVNRKIADRVSPLLEKHKQEREKAITSYVRDMKRAAKKIDIPGGRRGRAGVAGDYIERLVDAAMEDVEDTGELPETIPERAPNVFHDLTENTKEDLEKLDKSQQAAMKKELDFYTNGLLKKATDITKDGFTRQAAQIKDIVDGIGEDTSKFVSQLGL